MSKKLWPVLPYCYEKYLYFSEPLACVFGEKNKLMTSLIFRETTLLETNLEY